MDALVLLLSLLLALNVVVAGWLIARPLRDAHDSRRPQLQGDRAERTATVPRAAQEQWAPVGTPRSAVAR